MGPFQTSLSPPHPYNPSSYEAAAIKDDDLLCTWGHVCRGFPYSSLGRPLAPKPLAAISQKHTGLSRSLPPDSQAGGGPIYCNTRNNFGLAPAGSVYAGADIFRCNGIGPLIKMGRRQRYYQKETFRSATRQDC